MKILVINAGSSSLKYQLIDMEGEKLLAKGLCERIGLDGKFTYKPLVEGKNKIDAIDVAMPTHAEAIQAVLDALVDPANGVVASMEEIDAVGHRVLHGGKEFTKSCLIDAAKVNKEAGDMLSAMNTKFGHETDKIISLSGGNQQKVILSRWLLSKPEILIVDEPTHGIDVGAKFEIYQLLRKLADDGMAIIFISSELPEVMGMSDKIVTMYRSKVSAVVDANDPKFEEKVGNGIMGITVE